MKYIILVLAITSSVRAIVYADLLGGEIRGKVASVTKAGTTQPLNRDYTFLFFNYRLPGIARFSIVQKHGPDVAIVQCRSNGEPICFAKNNTVVVLDRKIAGGLETCNATSWKFEVGSASDDDLLFGFSLPSPSDKAGSGLYWDPVAIISAYLKDERESAFEPACDSYFVSIPKGRLGIGFAPAEAGGPETLRFFSYYCPRYNLSALELDQRTASTIDLTGVDIARIVQLSSKVRTVDAATMRDDADVTPNLSSPETLASMTLLAKLLPIRCCYASFVHEFESQKLWLTSSVARSLAPDAKAKLAIEELAKHRSAELEDIFDDFRDGQEDIVDNFRSGRIDIGPTLEKSWSVTDIGREVEQSLPATSYPKFVKRYLTAACPFPLDCPQRSAIVRAIDLIDATSASPATKIAIANDCLEFEMSESEILDESLAGQVGGEDARTKAENALTIKFRSEVQQQVNPTVARAIIDRISQMDDIARPPDK